MWIVRYGNLVGVDLRGNGIREIREEYSNFFNGFFYKGEERYNIVFGGEIRLRANGRNNRLCIDGNYLVKKKNLRIKKREVIWSSVFE